MKERKCGQWSTQKKRAVLAVVIALLALLAVPVLAWLYMQRSIETITKINMPYALRIGAGDTQDIKQLELSNIDVSGGEGKDVVFCVYSSEAGKNYHLQLAHTTNIGFKYQIYKAAMADGEGTDESIRYLGKQYTKREALKGKYLNQNEDGYATNTYHEKTYGKYGAENVQKSAEPLYWRTTNEEILPKTEDSTGYYVNYYILHISWDSTVQNNKETDMIYLMAGSVAS